jgi:Tfp pilus assembly protein PilF
MKRRWPAIGMSVFVLAGCANLPRRLAFDRDPLSPGEHISLGEAYVSHGEEPLAVQQYKAALRLDRHYVPALMALGNIAFDHHDMKQARSYYKLAWKAVPNDAAAANNLAMVDLAEGRLSEARKRIEKALPGAGPVASYLWDTLANIERREGRWAEAKQSLDRARASGPAQDPDFSKHLQESQDALAQAELSNFAKTNR